MALTPKYTALALNTKVDALAALLNAGFIDLYDGAQPATANTAVSTQTKLARLTFGTPAFGAGSGGVASANPITQESSADAGGDATWCRMAKADGTAVIDGSVGTSGANLNLSSVTIVVGAVVSVTSLTLTESTG